MTPKTLISLVALTASLTGCAVVAVADAAVSVVSTTAKIGASVVGTAVDVTAAGVRVATGTSKKD